MRLLYTKPKLYDLSQGSRIAFARQFRMMSQDTLSDKLGITGECRRRTVTRYEKGNRNPKEDRTHIIADILNINYNSIKKYDYKNPLDVVYILMWLEELMPNYLIDISKVVKVEDLYMNDIKKGINEWNVMRNKRLKREISYEEYIEWKLNYEMVVNYE